MKKTNERFSHQSTWNCQPSACQLQLYYASFLVQAWKPDSVSRSRVSYLWVFVQIAMFLNALIVLRVDPTPVTNVIRVMYTIQWRKLASVVKAVATQQFAYNVSPSIFLPKWLRNVFSVVGRLLNTKINQIIVRWTATIVQKRNVPNVNLGFSWKSKTPLAHPVQMSFVLNVLTSLAQSVSLKTLF